MSEPTLKCFSCKNEIPVGKYYQLYQGQQAKVGDYCSPCWDKEKTRYEIEIKNGMLKVIEAERERERERANPKSNYQVVNANIRTRNLKQ